MSISNLTKLSIELYNFFFYNKRVFAIQHNDKDDKPAYKTIYETIDSNKIEYYIKNKNAIMTYQQTLDKLQWLCLDFDIATPSLEDNYKFNHDNKNRPLLLNDVNIAKKYLDDIGIDYILEYSGNRGIHIWILLKEVVSKELGYKIITTIYENINFETVKTFDSPIKVDLFPKTKSAKGNRIGLGVKIPISYHLKSLCYSFMINSTAEISEISELTEDFLKKQYEIISKAKRNSVYDLRDKLNIKNLETGEIFTKKTGQLKESKELSEIIQMLSRSIIYKNLFNKGINRLIGKEKQIIATTIIRIKSNDNSKYGLKLLQEYFSTANNYDEEKTMHNLEKLKYWYPPNIEYLEKEFNIRCEYCKINNIKNALDLIDGLEIKEFDEYEGLITNAIKGEIRYLEYNDEVPWNFIKEDMENLDEEELKNYIIDIIQDGKWIELNGYKYIRKEETKDRILYGLDAKSRVVTTAIMKYIYSILGIEKISPFSYSYRINNFNSNDIFINWYKLWEEFSKDVRDIIISEAYQDYYVIKFDVSKYYDSINLTFLTDILLNSNTERIINLDIELKMKGITEKEFFNYSKACEFLVDACKKITKNQNYIGIPQGPAFARYLGEIYLSHIDYFLANNLNNNTDRVFRYVDDYYIFIKDITKGENFFLQIKNELEKISLSSSSSKKKEGILRDIKDEIIDDFQFIKYFIDSIDEGSISIEKDKSSRLLNNMFDEIKSSDDSKDIAFFLTHLRDEKYLRTNSKEIVNKIVNLDVGRGSIYKHFYRNIAFKYSKCEFYKEISGLSLSNFINELGINIQEDKIEKEKAIQIINYYLERGV